VRRRFGILGSGRSRFSPWSLFDPEAGGAGVCFPAGPHATTVLNHGFPEADLNELLLPACRCRVFFSLSLPSEQVGPQHTASIRLIYSARES